MLRIILSLMILLPGLAISSQAYVKLEKAPVDHTDFASLQRGAQIYFNNCQGCHSLKYERYNGLAKGIGITDEEGNVLEEIVKKNILFVGDKITDPILTAMPKSASESWFGIAPPDLTLVTRYRSADWVYTYMKSFYKDPNRPWGVNNLVFPDVGMPHVLLHLQGVQEPLYKSLKKVASDEKMEKQIEKKDISEAIVKDEKTEDKKAAEKDTPEDTVEKIELDLEEEKQIVGLELVKPGSMSVAEYDQAVGDLVNFLSYVGEPVKLKRERIGIFVLAFLGILLVFAYLLKREYWKDIK